MGGKTKSQNVHTTRSLHRGLRVLELLNVRKGLSVTEIARHVELPRTTTYRILENLVQAGYLTRGHRGEHYRLTIAVRRLSCGFDDEEWMIDVAGPLLQSLFEAVVWPVAFLTVKGTGMLLRKSYDVDSPLAIDYYGEGTVLPITTTASGMTALAYLPEKERVAIIEACAASDDPRLRVARDAKAMKAKIAEVRRQGCAFNIRSPRSHEPSKTSTISVPVFVDDHYMASLTMRYIDSALTADQVNAEFVPILKDHAARIGAACTETFHASETGSDGKATGT